MKRTLYTTFAAALCVLALAASGCEKKKEGEGGAAGGAAKGAAGAAAALPAKTGFAVFPGDSQFVVGINLASARSSGLYAKYKDKIEENMAKELADMREACGVDPIGQMQTIIAAGKPPAGGTGDPEVVVVLKGLQRATMKQCGEKMAAKEGKKFTVTEEGNLANYLMDDKNIWAAWLDDSTVVMAPEKDKAYVSARAAGESGLADGNPVMALLKSVDTSAALYFAADTKAFGPGAAMMQGAQGIFGSLKLTDGLAIDAGVRFDTPDNAKKTTEMVNQQVGAMKGQLPPQFKTLADKAVIKQVNNDLVLQLSLSGPELEQLASALEGMKGMLGGGMGGGGL